MFTSILTIKKVNVDYDGKFKVVLKNVLGEADSTTQVTVNQCMHTFEEKLSLLKINVF